MNRLTRGKPLLFIVCLLFGIALFLIYNLMAPLAPFSAGYSTASDKGVSYLHQAQNQQSESDKEQSNALSVLGNDNQDATSRGQSMSRYIGRDRDSQTEQKSGIQAGSGETQAADSTAANSASTDSAATPKATSTKMAAVTPPAQAVTPSKGVAPKTTAESAAEKSDPASDDLDLLARLITAEAQGEPYEAQVAIGAVVLNRVQSSDWPDTIKSVIYQKIGGYYQFTPVVNGWIDKPAQTEAVKAAKEALNGADPTNGAQFYYDDKCTNEWILAKPVSTQIGHMIFAM